MAPPPPAAQSDGAVSPSSGELSPAPRLIGAPLYGTDLDEESGLLGEAGRQGKRSPVPDASPNLSEDETDALVQVKLWQLGHLEAKRRKSSAARGTEEAEGAACELSYVAEAPAHAQPRVKPPSGGVTRAAATSNLITCMIGASVLSLPRMVADSGWIFGPVMLALAGLVSATVCLLVDQAIESVANHTVSWPRNIGDIVEVLFGPRVRVLVVAFTCYFQVAKCTVYFVVIGANLHYWGDTVTERQCILIAAGFGIWMVYIRDISVLSNCSIVGTSASLVYLFTIAAGSFRAATTLPTDERDMGLWPQRGLGGELFETFAIMLYAYSPADVLPMLKSNMAEPRKVRGSVITAHSAVAGIYVCLASAGYYGWGHHVQGNILQSMCGFPGCRGAVTGAGAPGPKWWMGYALSTAVVCNLGVTIPLVLFSVFSMLEAQHERLQRDQLANNVVRSLVFVLAVSIAVFVPYFIQILAVISTCLLVVLQIFLPVAMTYELKRRGLVAFGTREAFLLALGVLVLVVGLQTAIRNLLQAIAEG